MKTLSCYLLVSSVCVEWEPKEQCDRQSRRLIFPSCWNGIVYIDICRSRIVATLVSGVVHYTRAQKLFDVTLNEFLILLFSTNESTVVCCLHHAMLPSRLVYSHSSNFMTNAQYLYVSNTWQTGGWAQCVNRIVSWTAHVLVFCLLASVMRSLVSYIFAFCHVRRSQWCVVLRAYATKPNNFVPINTQFVCNVQCQLGRNRHRPPNGGLWTNLYLNFSWKVNICRDSIVRSQRSNEMNENWNNKWNYGKNNLHLWVGRGSESRVFV